MRRRAGSGASRRSHHAHAWRWCACGSRSGGRGASSCLARSRVCLKNPVVRACWGRASGARAAGISAGGCQTRGAGKPCARLGEVCALEGPPWGAPWGGGDGVRFAAFTLVDAFAPKNGFTLDPQIWVKPTSKFLPSECQPAQQSNRFGITMNSLSRTSQQALRPHEHDPNCTTRNTVEKCQNFLIHTRSRSANHHVTGPLQSQVQPQRVQHQHNHLDRQLKAAH